MPARFQKILFFIICLFIYCRGFGQLNADFSVCSSCSTAGCPPFQTQFKYTGTGTPKTYTWTLNSGASIPPNNSSPSTTYFASGTYTISLTVSDGVNTSTKTKTAYITVYDTPKVDFVATPLTGCPPLAVSFTSTGNAGGNGNNTYSWIYGDGNFYTGTNIPAHSYVTGIYSVRLTLTNSNGCKGTKAKQNYIDSKPLPKPNFKANDSYYCSSPANVTFIDATTGNGPFSYSWDLGDGNTSTQSNPPHSYTGLSPSFYTVKLLVKDVNGCMDSIRKLDYISIFRPHANFTAPASTCTELPVQFLSTAVPITSSYSWDFGDGNTANVANPTHVYMVAGTFNVRMIATYKGCSDTLIQAIDVHPKPVADFTTTDSPCPAPVPITFTPNGSYAQYQWDFGDGTLPFSNSPLPIHIYQNNGYFTPTLYVTTSFGCKDTITKKDKVKIYNLKWDPWADTLKGCIPLTVHFKTVTNTTTTPPYYPTFEIYPYSPTMKTWFWDFAGKGTSTSPTPAFTFTDTGIYVVNVTVTTANGCPYQKSLLVTTGTPPHASFIASPLRVCKSDTVTFTSKSTGRITGTHWDFGDLTSADGIVVKHNFISSGKKYTRLIEEFNGCEDDTTIQLINVDSPSADIYLKYDCSNDRAVFFADSSVGATGSTWYFGDNTSSTAKTPWHVYPAAGTYTVKLATYNTPSGCLDTASRNVTVVTPVLNLNADDTAVCLKDTIHFTAPLSGRRAVTYTWHLNNKYIIGSIDSFLHYSRPFNPDGFYNIKVKIADDHGCTDSADRNVFVSKPVASFTPDISSGCVPFTVNFTDKSHVTTGASITNYDWDYGNGFGISTGSISRLYNLPGTYPVKLRITDNVGCRDSLSFQSIGAHDPKAFFLVKNNACLNETVSFNNASLNANTYQWDFGDGYQSTATNPTHTYKKLGSYDVKLIATDNFGCSSEIKLYNRVTVTRPAAAFTMSDTLSACQPPIFVQFTNNSQRASTYNWIFGNGLTATAFNPTTAYSDYGIDTIYLVATDTFGCADTTTGYMRVLGYAGLLSDTPQLGCAPLDVTFSPNIGDLASITWDFNDGFTQTVPGTNTPVHHTYSFHGSYLPRIILADNKGCKIVSYGTDTIHVDAAVAGFKWGPACEYSDVILLDTSKSFFTVLYSWLWTFDDGSQSYKQNPTHRYGALGTYPVKLVVKNSIGCIDSIAKDITLNVKPIIDAGPDTTICLHDSAVLYPSGGISYSWSPGYYLDCTNCENPHSYAAKNTTYIATGTDANGCKNTDSVTVRVKTKATAATKDNINLCLNDTANLFISGAHNYQWFPPDELDDPQSGHPAAWPRKDITYTVVAYEASCIADTHHVHIKILPLPTVEASGDQTIVASYTTELHASGTLISRYEWTPAENLGCPNCPSTTARPSRTTTYWVKAYSDGGCVDSDDVVVTVLCDKSQLFLPNTFTPNGDGQNDVFYPRGSGLDRIKSFRIYNRWGEMVFERTAFALNDAAIGWDGTFKGNVLSPDVFVYAIEAYCDNGSIMVVKGDVTILR